MKLLGGFILLALLQLSHQRKFVVFLSNYLFWHKFQHDNLEYFVFKLFYSLLDLIIDLVPLSFKTLVKVSQPRATKFFDQSFLNLVH